MLLRTMAVPAPERGLRGPLALAADRCPRASASASKSLR